MMMHHTRRKKAAKRIPRTFSERWRREESQWVGDREDGFDRFEFEFKRSGVCVLNITDLKKRLDPISLVAMLQINVIVKVSH